MLQLPNCCVSYSNIQGHGMNLPTVNPANSAGSPLYTPTAPSPPGYTPTGARCNAGPCINTCCTLGPDGFCLDNLLAQGGHYAPGEAQSFFSVHIGYVDTVHAMARNQTVQCAPGNLHRLS